MLLRALMLTMVSCQLHQDMQQHQEPARACLPEPGIDRDHG